MGQSIYGATNQESRRSAEVGMAQKRGIEALRADLAQLDEWLTKCEEMRLLDHTRITAELAREIASSPVAPRYLREEAEHRDRAILQVTDAIFVAQGELMAKLNILEGTVLWLSTTESKVSRRKTFIDGPEPGDCQITRRSIVAPMEPGPLLELLEDATARAPEVAHASLLSGAA